MLRNGGPIVHWRDDNWTHVGRIGSGVAKCKAGFSFRSEALQIITNVESMVDCRACLRLLRDPLAKELSKRFK